jgi:pimeloyl-ACP methyl ester carboxylesterase
VLITGAEDKIVLPKNSQDYVAAAQKSGDDARLIVLEKAAHFEVIAPGSSAWATVENAVLSVLDTKKK